MRLSYPWAGSVSYDEVLVCEVVSSVSVSSLLEGKAKRPCGFKVGGFITFSMLVVMFTWATPNLCFPGLLKKIKNK